MKEADLLSINDLLLIDKTFKLYYDESVFKAIDEATLKKIMLKILDLNDYLISQLKINTVKKEG